MIAAAGNTIGQLDILANTSGQIRVSLGGFGAPDGKRSKSSRAWVNRRLYAIRQPTAG